MDEDAKFGRGFSIIELSMTIFILGIVFAMTLKGKDLVENMRAFIVSYQISQFQNSVFAYQSSHGALPGDDTRAAQRFGREAAMFLINGSAVTMIGNSRIDGLLSDALRANGENFMAWRDLRYAGAVDGDPAVAGASAMPENPFGGVYGFDEGNLGQREGSLCVTRVPGRAAQMIDDRMDDGIINHGKVVATSRYDAVEAKNHFDAPDSEPYDFEKEYIICAPILP